MNSCEKQYYMSRMRLIFSLIIILIQDVIENIHYDNNAYKNVLPVSNYFLPIDDQSDNKGS